MRFRGGVVSHWQLSEARDEEMTILQQWINLISPERQDIFRYLQKYIFMVDVMVQPRFDRLLLQYQLTLNCHSINTLK
jgi:hypothetical protein